VVDGVRPIVSAFEKGSNVGRNVRCSRTGGLAGNIHVHVVKIFRAGRKNDLLGHVILARWKAQCERKNLPPRKHEIIKIREKCDLFVLSHLRVFVVGLPFYSGFSGNYKRI
jgi:hypothetical protein